LRQFELLDLDLDEEYVYKLVVELTNILIWNDFNLLQLLSHF